MRNYVLLVTRILKGVTSIESEERDWLSLPCRYGGLGLVNPNFISEQQYCASKAITQPLVHCLGSRCREISPEVWKEQESIISRVSKLRLQEITNTTQQVRGNLSPDRQRLMDIACERGASVWLSALPLKEHGFDLHKGSFRDALCIRYGWHPPLLPSECVCGATFSVDHSLSCPNGGFPTLRHNELRDLTATFLKDICHNVCKEPSLQPLSGESLSYKTACHQDGARLDVAADGFWGCPAQRVYFDVKVVNPLSQTYRGLSLQTCYKRAEDEKKRKYDQRVREVEFGCFSPLIFSTAGGFGPISSIVFKRIASIQSEKHQRPYSSVINFIRCKLAFSVLRSTIRCLRGTRSKPPTPLNNDFPHDFDVALSEGHVTN